MSDDNSYGLNLGSPFSLSLPSGDPIILSTLLSREGRTHQMEKLQERRIQKFMKENSWKNEENSKRIWKEKLQLQRRRLRRRRPRRR